MTTSDQTSDAPTRRAASMSPEDRRDAIAQAAAELLIEHGTALTTRQIAEAAGIAEGTIFRVFADKEAVIWAAAAVALDHSPTLTAIDEIDRSLPLEDRVALAVGIFQSRAERVFRVMAVVNTLGASAHLKEKFFADSRQDLSSLASLFEADAEQLRVSAREAAFLMQSITFGASHPLFSSGDPLSATDIASLTLDGIRNRDTPQSNTSQ